MLTRREALAAGAALATGPPALGSADDPTAAARAAIGEYAKNLRAFARYQCKFTTRRGTADSAADAKAGKINARIVGDSTFTADGQRVRLDNHGIPLSKGLAGKKSEPIPGTNLGRTYIDFFEENVYLSNGREELLGNDIAANVYTPDLPASPQPLHPLTIWQFDFRLEQAPDRMAEQPDEYDLRGEGRQTVDGRATVRVRFEAKSKDGPWMAWVVDFDPARGHLPYRVQMLAPPFKAKGPLRVVGEAWVLEAKDCGKGRFFPTRVVHVSPSFGGETTVDAWETVVRSIDPDFKPTPETFEYRPPAGTGVIYLRAGASPSIGLAPGEVITPESLPDLVKRQRPIRPKKGGG
ncbi:MAG: hypothetical protein K2X87_28200 [Gemmataceae bacterium]|nr:hypothetical protein [Gemmataceae bacterium]